MIRYRLYRKASPLGLIWLVFFFVVTIGHPFGGTGSCYGLVFEDYCQSTTNWEFLDYKANGKIYVTRDRSCPPGYGPNVLHIEGGVVLGLAKGATLTKGTFVVLYKENRPRSKDGDGVIMFWARYGQDISAEHNTKIMRAHVWFEQDNDCGIQFRAIDDKSVESQIEERAGVGLVTDAWNQTGWIWQKVRIDGELIRSKFWPAEQIEPEGWSLEARYDLKGERFGLRINSGDINVAYFAADTADIKRPVPRAYLFFPHVRATQLEKIPLTLFTNAERATKETFEVVVSSGTRQLAKKKFDAPIARGYGETVILLSCGEVDSDSDAINVPLLKPLSPGLCKVVVSSDSGAYRAERVFEVARIVDEHRRFDDAAVVIDRLGKILDGVDRKSEKVAALKVICDVARAHLKRAMMLFENGKIGQADMAFRFVTEALCELRGYKGVWLNELAPEFKLEDMPEKFDDRRGIAQRDNGFSDFYSTDYRMRFGAVELAAQSMVMGQSYEVVIPWMVEGDRPDRDFDFNVRLVSPLGNRTVASAKGGIEVASSRWEAGKVYRQRVRLDVLAEDARQKPSQPVVLDEYHHLLVTVTDPSTGARVILGNRPGKHPDRVGESFVVDELYVSSTPLEVRNFKPDSLLVGQPRKDRMLIANVGDRMLSCDALFTVVTETGRVVCQQVRPVRISAGGRQSIEYDWVPNAVGGLMVHVRLMRNGVTLTELRRKIDIAAPMGFDLDVVKGTDVEKRGERFIVPLTVRVGDGLSVPVSVKVMAKGRVVGQAKGKGGSLMVTAEPWFGYYDVIVELDKFSYDRRIIATVVRTEGSDILVNGESFIVKGVNVHGMDPSSPERTASMMRIMRELGFNAWRGDYPAPWQTDLAYELNTFYTVLVPYSCTPTADIFARQVGPPMATSRELTRLFIERYRDSAGVLLWNSANEINGENIDFLISQYPVYKAFDPERRPVHYANLYGQELWQGQDVVGVNYYFGESQTAVDRQLLIKRSFEMAQMHGMSTMFCEYNSYHGAIHSTGVEAMRDLFAWGVEKAGMVGGFLYMKGNSASHPGVFDAGFNTHKIFNEAIREAFADARVELAGVDGDRVRLRIINKRRFTLRQIKMSLKASGVKIKPMQLENLGPEGVVEVEVVLPDNVAGPTVLLDGELAFVTHYGFRCKVRISLIAE